MKFLRQIRVAKPCHENWDSMSGEEQSKFCGQCQKSVHNLSEMTPKEAKDLLLNEEKPCIRYIPDANGAPIYKGTAAWKTLLAAGAVGMIAASGCSPAPAEPQQTPVKPPKKSAPKVIPPAMMGEALPNYEMGNVATPVMGDAVMPEKAKPAKKPTTEK